MRLSGARWLAVCLFPLFLAACGNDAREKELSEQLAQAQQDVRDAKASAAEARRVAAQQASNTAGLSDFYGAEGDGEEMLAPEPDDMSEDEFASDGFDSGSDVDIPSADANTIEDGAEAVPQV